MRSSYITLFFGYCLFSNHNFTFMYPSQTVHHIGYGTTTCSSAKFKRNSSSRKITLEVIFMLLFNEQKSYKQRICNHISNMFCANDRLVSTNGEHRSIKQLLKIIMMYERWSRQSIKTTKSVVFFSDKTNSIRRRGLLRLSGFVEGNFPLLILWLL